MRLLILFYFCTLAACTRENEPGRTADAGLPACVDGDGDGYGEGAGCRDVDCDDGQASVHVNAPELCDGLDNDCNGAVDDGLVLPDCGLTEGVCAGARRRCVDGILAVCTGVESYGAEFEDEERRCDGLDNDCDGDIDGHCPCDQGSTQPCGQGVGECTQGIQQCPDGQWGACEGAVGPVDEACNGRDDDCDGQTDEAIEGPGCALTAGLCAGARSQCVGGAFATCGATEYGPNFVAEEGPTHCDEVDNDCDGSVDEGGCGCPDGSDRACGLDVGACQPGSQRCTAGTWGECQGAVVPGEEACNGADDDCDGVSDEAVVAPPCALQAGVCAGALAVCAGAAGFAACEPEAYGPLFHVDETADHCDGADNDCDGQTDEACSAAPVRISELRVGGPGDDGLSAFIELVGPPGQSLNGFVLEAVNGSNGMVYRTLPLEGARIPASGWFLMVEAGTPASPGAQGVLRNLADLVVRGVDLQNGPDSLRLVFNGQVVDAVGYGAFGANDTFAGEGMAAADPGDAALSRDGQSTDTDNNANDFTVVDVPTPGGGPLPRLHVAMRWAEGGTDYDLHLLRGAFRTEDDCHWGDRTPPWGPNGERGDPILPADVQVGPGLEVIHYRDPAPRMGGYVVLVHYAGFPEDPPAAVVVEIYADGVLAGAPYMQEITTEMPFWAVAVIEVDAERMLRVEPLDLVGDQPLEP